MPQSVKQTIGRNGHLAPKQIDMLSLNLLQLDKSPIPLTLVKGKAVI
jgi:hypothetical protein